MESPSPPAIQAEASSDEALLPCDVIMKGGITSGVVYPPAIIALSKKYRLQNIGGTSAGAIAAAVAAAAEYGRAMHGSGRKDCGYHVLADIPGKIQQDLFTLFQPTPEMRPLFDSAMAARGGKTGAGKLARGLVAAMRGHPLATAAGVLAGVALPGLLALKGLQLGLGMRVVLPGVGGLAGASSRIANTLTEELPENGFGMCTGLTQPGYTEPAITDWLAETINLAAGRAATDPPLTFGDLKAAKHGAITLQVMTTNLSKRRPYRLPMETRIYAFRRSEFAKLFPVTVLQHMTKGKDRQETFNKNSDYDDWYYFPKPDDLPVVVAARMSLSFPGLISAVPLYAFDHTRMRKIAAAPAKTKREVLRRCWFSDGGLSSNFPIHLFDKVFPKSPTFGITLEPFCEGRHDENFSIPIPMLAAPISRRARLG